ASNAESLGGELGLLGGQTGGCPAVASLDQQLECGFEHGCAGRRSPVLLLPAFPGHPTLSSGMPGIYNKSVN
ncbi:MAG TPA: hypothetical protein P5138_03270, partial [Solirubrobacterales bacterium]|nr:hypothetical protein [Solirubrobacterales bacterium]